MTIGKPPAFQFYAADFDMDTGPWTAPQVGVYVRLLMSAWVNGGLPNNMAEIARIARVDNRTLAKMWKATLAKKWTLTPENMYINPRLEFERQKQQNYKERQRLKGEIRAKEMWKDHIAVAKNRLQPDYSSSSSSSSSSKNKKPPTPLKGGEVILPEWLNKEAWKRYLEHRILSKSKMTPYAQVLAIKHLKIFIDQGMDHVAVINQSIENGWKGLFELKNKAANQETASAPDWICKKCHKKVRALQGGLCDACYEG